jgi:hypothetical protein
MRFTCSGTTYNTEEMICLEGDLGQAVGVFITLDHRMVFAAYQFDDGVRVGPVLGSHLRSLAKQLRHPALMAALEAAEQSGCNPEYSIK